MLGFYAACAAAMTVLMVRGVAPTRGLQWWLCVVAGLAWPVSLLVMASIALASLMGEED